MTYDVLTHINKADLIAWLRDNVTLPNITDEQFQEDIGTYRAKRIAEANERAAQLSARLSELISENNELNRLIDTLPNEPLEQMHLMIQSDKRCKEYIEIMTELRQLQQEK